ncbi:cysteine dioxygenase family protein [Pararhizobium mangrovi]|uniref:Cysteine dioxygenase n=1 Tax=Pararhizobium mangrovi TaxID=2590452 RepID=A0A506TXE7_9HYPH|nr:cysteine dioxygenase family protein [Pararhizobium mangrovi]TPW25986.1 hypothetical protein FJU11_16745 [Pararhizobium mangrovi]
MDLAKQRRDAAIQMVDDVKATVTNRGLDRDVLASILEKVRQLADHRDYWVSDDFPAPDEETRQARYLIHEEPDHSYALYLNVMQPGRRIPPHNHTTWACVAGVEGEEHNFVYRRTDDGKTPGKAELELSNHVTVGPDSGIALMPDDIHSVEIQGNRPIRHLHMYGRALETLSERLTFDPEAKTCKPMPIGVQTKR